MFQPPPDSNGVDAHVAALVEFMHTVAAKYFTKPCCGPRKSWISGLTWSFLTWIAPVRRKLLQSRMRLRHILMRLYLVAWS
eukprot:2892976-Karenia_brevis.AAC.1